ncbi:MAG: hypothetical protein QM719_02535 [Thermomonas sp.]
MTPILPMRKSISWRTVALLSAGLIACMCAIAFLWPHPKQFPSPARIVDPPPPFVPSPAFEAANDLAVLRTVLEPYCRADHVEILVSESSGKHGNRSNSKPEKLPEGLSCPGVKMVDSDELKALLNEPYRGKSDSKRFDALGNLHDVYPDATAVLSLSLPSYPSPSSAVVELGATCGRLCGSGWKITLIKASGKWIVQDRHPTWIA